MDRPARSESQYRLSYPDHNIRITLQLPTLLSPTVDLPQSTQILAEFEIHSMTLPMYTTVTAVVNAVFNDCSAVLLRDLNLFSQPLFNHTCNTEALIRILFLLYCVQLLFGNQTKSRTNNQISTCVQYTRAAEIVQSV